MTDPTPAPAYAARLERVAAHIADRLDQPLDLDALADIACLSRYHFHRVYRGVLGETPADTVRRLRLARAAGALARGKAPLQSIARDAGYGSSEAFSRAFAAAYGRPPMAYRRARAELGLPAPANEETTAMYTVTLSHFPGARLIGLPHQGDYNAIGGTFEKLYASAAAHGLIGPATRSFGVYFDDPAAVPQAKLRSFAGLVIPDGAAVPAGLETHEIPAGEVANLVHVGPYDQLEQAYRYLYRAWLPTSGREPADRPCFEEYLNNPRDLPPTEWRTQVAMPLA